jgi:AraC-like DNA-binding protein
MTSLEARESLVGSLETLGAPVVSHSAPDGFLGAAPWRLAGSPGQWVGYPARRCATVLMPRFGSCAVSVEGRKPVFLDPRRALLVPAGRSFRMASVTPRQATGRAIRMSNEVVEALGSFPAESRRGREFPFVAEIPDLVAILAALNRWKANPCDSRARLDVVAALRSAVLTPSPAPGGDSRSIRTVRRTRMLLVDRYAQPLTLASIGRSLDLSPYYVCHAFRRHFGVSIHQFLLDLRVRAALELISNGPASFGELGDRLGFSSPSHFASAIRARVGFTPSDLARLIVPSEMAG